MLGRVLGERYRLKEKLGSGGMADVYLADDLLLNREVAVKVLHPQFASDPSYIHRFLHEAQAAANLNHPAIVDVYDWGNDGELYYLVMEFVEGMDLKQVIQREGRLLPARAAEIAAEIASALQFAHQRKLVHRDIKPHNIFITNLGQVKVMDLGIARVGTGNGMTQTGMVMGTPQYISPEQAQGLSVDGRSDIYSLGVVLYEMVTGKVPFDDPNPMTVAYKQVKEEPLPPSALVPDVPPALEAIIMKAMAKNPANRYQTAQEMKADLLRFLDGLPVSAIPLLPERTQPVEEPAPTFPTAEARPSRWWIWALVGLGVLALLALVLALTLGRGAAKVEVPDLRGMSEEQARKTLEEAGLKVGEISYSYIKKASEKTGVVVAQDPEPGVVVKKGEKVNLTVTREMKMPRVIGMAEDQALQLLRDTGLQNVDRTTKMVDDPGQVGKVLSQDPAEGTFVSPSTQVRLVVGVEMEKVTVPNVVGMEKEQAMEAISAAGFKAEVREEFSADTPQGTVVSQSPAPGQKAPKGSTVTITVSKGPATVVVPNVVNMSESAARNKLEGFGLLVEVTYRAVVDPADDGKVLRQVPSPGTEVMQGATVKLEVGKKSS